MNDGFSSHPDDGKPNGNSPFDEDKLFNETPEQACSRIIREAAPFAAAALSEMAADTTISPSVRYNAAKYIVERNLGPVSTSSRDSDLESFLQELQADAASGRYRSE